MTILQRFQIGKATVSINQTEGQIMLEIFGTSTPDQYRAIKNYLIEEGILEAVITGNPHFDKVNVETLLEK